MKSLLQLIKNNSICNKKTLIPICSQSSVVTCNDNVLKTPITPIVEDHIKSLVYGTCIGDAIGLLTEYMTKKQALCIYGKSLNSQNGMIRYFNKYNDNHRSRWLTGDWTDESDQMILLIQSIQNNNVVDSKEFARKILKWKNEGFKELGDNVGMGIGINTNSVLRDGLFLTDPIKVARKLWLNGGKVVAGNGCITRTGILGAFNFNDTDQVIKNTLNICKVTHADIRCQISCVAVSLAISEMLKKFNSFKFVASNNIKNSTMKLNKCQLTDILKTVENRTEKCLYEINEKEVTHCERQAYWKEFLSYYNEEDLTKMNLDSSNKMGYVYKCMGSAFWALKQDSFKEAITNILLEAGDADSNASVAGALLGCKLGMNKIPEVWVTELAENSKCLLNKNLNMFIDQFFKVGVPTESVGKNIC